LPSPLNRKVLLRIRPTYPTSISPLGSPHLPLTTHPHHYLLHCCDIHFLPPIAWLTFIPMAYSMYSLSPLPPPPPPWTPQQ
jgi:hypothetical protein